MRYEQLVMACYLKQPVAILEIGTWNGVRAQQLLQVAPRARYFGFDLFEDATEQSDAEELNVKPHHRIVDVQARLAGHKATLVKGNTRYTLPSFNEPVDFVWMDGGHSVETIVSDFANVRRVATDDAEIYLDDYYSGPIDTELFGCNKLVEGLKHNVLPAKDPVSGGGFVQMVRVWL
jgi:predicted O-methyltransferase YrrM